LEEVAAAFGDRVMTLAEADVAAEQTVFEKQGASEHVERAEQQSQEERQ
jgi:hypothetical protein